MGHLVDIQSALKPLKKSEKIEQICMTILERAESFKMMTKAGALEPSIK